jgi:hypothetical protein
MLLLLCRCVAAQEKPGTLPDAPSTTVQAKAGVFGVVNDIGGTPVSDAQITAIGLDGFSKKTVSDGEGEFRLDGLPAGDVIFSVKAEGLMEASTTVTLLPGSEVELPAFSMKVAMTNFQVDAISQTELADLQIKQEETQRLLGIMPNFYVVYDRNAVALNTKQKYKLAARSIVDPINFVVVGVNAGIEQAQNTFAGYGQGTSGYAKRFAANYANSAIGTVLGGAVYPSFFHQDPRYFYDGRGSIASRAWYAIFSAVRCKGDNGKWQPAYASVLGDFSAGAISNAYYPASDRDGFKLTMRNGATSVASDAFDNLIQEFLLKHFTPKQVKSTNP